MRRGAVRIAAAGALLVVGYLAMGVAVVGRIHARAVSLTVLPFGVPAGIVRHRPDTAFATNRTGQRRIHALEGRTLVLLGLFARRVASRLLRLPWLTQRWAHSHVSDCRAVERARSPVGSAPMARSLGRSGSSRRATASSRFAALRRTAAADIGMTWNGSKGQGRLAGLGLECESACANGSRLAFRPAARWE